MCSHFHFFASHFHFFAVWDGINYEWPAAPCSPYLTFEKSYATCLGEDILAPANWKNLCRIQARNLGAHTMIWWKKSTRMMGSLNHRYSILAQLPCIASTCLLTFLTKSPCGSWAIYFRYSVPIWMRCSCYLGVQAEENFWFQRWRKLERSTWTPTTTLGMFYSSPPENIDQNTTLKRSKKQTINFSRWSLSSKNVFIQNLIDLYVLYFQTHTAYACAQAHIYLYEKHPAYENNANILRAYIYLV